MPDERENGIHWTVTLQEAARYAAQLPAGEEPSSPAEHGAAIVAIAAEIWAWRQHVAKEGEFESSVAFPPTAAPAPPPRPAQPPVRAVEGQRPPEAPYGEEEPPHPAAQEAPPVEHAEQERCLCGSLMEFDPSKGSAGAWFCPMQKKSHDPILQASEKRAHPPIWLNAPPVAQ